MRSIRQERRSQVILLALIQQEIWTSLDGPGQDRVCYLRELAHWTTMAIPGRLEILLRICEVQTHSADGRLARSLRLDFSTFFWPYYHFEPRQQWPERLPQRPRIRTNLYFNAKEARMPRKPFIEYL